MRRYANLPQPASKPTNRMPAERMLNEHRTNDQLLLAAGPTRSWLMASQAADSTTLYFGSAVVPNRTDRNGRRAIGWIFHALLGFHQLYSRILLGCAARKLRRS
jgi:hypothetical protein